MAYYMRFPSVFLGGTLQRALHIAYLKIAMFTNRILRFT